jgi:ceramide glucosyltransferase
MLPYLSSVASALLLAAVLSGIAYLLAAIASVVAFARRRGKEPEGGTPAVTVLKPVCGIDHGLYENLRSFCDQDYPAFQVIFGVRDTLDPAVPVIQRVIREFSRCDAVLVIDDREMAGNFKVSNLANMYREARHDLLVIADSDMRVDRNYLRMVVKAFDDPRAGAATCLYSGTPVAGLSSILGAMFINDWFLPSVLVALALQDLRFCFGATMAVRREALAAIGGFDSLSTYLADDYMLGDLIARRGYTVRLCPYVVEGMVSEPDFRSLFTHELRWARTVRACRPSGYAFSIIGNGAVSLSALYLAASGFGAFGLALFVLAIGLRVVLHAAVRKAVRVPGPAAPWLIPLRDLLCLAIWVASFSSREVRWRGRRFSVRADGQLMTNGAIQRHEDPVP